MLEQLHLGLLCRRGSQCVLLCHDSRPVTMRLATVCVHQSVSACVAVALDVSTCAMYRDAT